MEYLSTLANVIIYIVVFLYGIIIGSFLNVVISRTPLHETLVSKRSHCMSCGYQLAWYDLIPLFSWIFLGGKCRKCKAKISVQYPIVEAATGILFVITVWIKGLNVLSVFSMLVICALLSLSVIDARTMEIPFGINVFIGVIGIINAVYCFFIKDWILNRADAGFSSIDEAYDFQMLVSFLIGDASDWIPWHSALIGFFVVSVPLYIALLVTKGRGMGGGDVKLMAAAGLFLGWKYTVAALILGCLYCVIIHPIRMKVSHADHKLAMGPYLSAGILTTIWFGGPIVNGYINLLSGLMGM